MRYRISRTILSFGILLSFLIVCFHGTACQVNVATSPQRHAIIFDYGNNGLKAMVSNLPGAIIVDSYDSFSHVIIPDDEISWLRNRGVVVQVLDDWGKIRFDAVSVDTAVGEPTIPSEYRAKEPAPGEYGYYLVQMKGPPKKGWVDTIANSGCQVVEISGFGSYIVKMKPELKGKLSKLDFINWIGIYHPFYKLRGSVEHLNGVIDINVILFEGADFARAFDQISSMGGEIKSHYSSSWWVIAKVCIDSTNLARITSLPDVWSVEPSREPVVWMTPGSGNGIFNDNAKWVIQSGINGSTPIWDQGLHGENITVGLTDTGIDYDHAAFTDAAGNRGVPGTGHRKIVRYWTFKGDDWDNGKVAHGTHTAGSIAGNNITNPGQYNKNDGMAYMARISFADLQKGPFFNAPDDMAQVFLDAKNNSAISDSNSWGFQTNEYSALAQSADQFMWDNPEFLGIIAAGNRGPGTSTVSPPGTAKNVVTVGACNSSDRADLMCSFSGRGPTPDSVRKPDVVAPGWEVISAAGDITRDNYESGYKPMNGTSMATPITAGACALIEQYFREGFYPSGQKTLADGFVPSGPLRKAMLINSGHDMTGADAHIPDNSQGWGRVTLNYSLYFKGNPRKLWLHDEYMGGSGLNTGEKWTQNADVGSSQELKITLVWNDYPGHGLKNDLDLVVKAPNGDTFIGSNFQNGVSVADAGAQPDDKNPVECVYIKVPQSGTYTIEVTAASVSTAEPQKFALVATGEVNAKDFRIRLDSPKAGDVIHASSAFNVSWATTGGTPPVTVELLFSNDSGAHYTSIVGGESATSNYTWTVPGLDKTTMRIKVTATDANSNKTSAESGDFTITTTTVHEFAFVIPTVVIAMIALFINRKKRGIIKS